VEEGIADKLVRLAKIDSLKKSAGTVERNAQKIDGQCVSLNSGTRRILRQARTVLARIGAAPVEPGESTVEARHPPFR